MKLLKFGGSSVADADRIDNVAKILKTYLDRGEEFAVVVSALGGLTDLLIQMSQEAEAGDLAYKSTFAAFTERHFEVVDQLISAKRQEIVKYELREWQIELANILQGIYLIRELSPRTLDIILSQGERHSAFLLSEVLRDRNIVAQFVDARKLVRTNSQYGNAQVDFETTYQNIQAYWKKVNGLPIITGFIASDEKGATTTLGRGGSDYTVSFFGAALEAEVIEIWTDVNGVLTADPRKVRQAFSIEQLTYEEAMEMSHFGAKVIYPPTLVPAMEKSIPIRIKNSFEPEHPGTLISGEPAQDDAHPVKGITSIKDLSILTLQGGGLFGVSGSNLTARLFSVLAQEEINIILITQGSSEQSLSFAVRPEQAILAQNAINQAFELEIRARMITPVKIEEGLSVIAVIGENMKSRPGISARLFSALGRNGINVALTVQGSSERNITVVISKEDETKALNAVHEAFFLSDTFSLNLFMVGVGLIGSTLIQQIQDHAKFLREERYMEVNLVALANTKKMIFDDNGIDLGQWKESLAQGEPSDLKGFMEKMIALNLPNSIFVDNTANNEIANFYESILDNSISISTANKVAASSKYALYEQLKAVADKRGVHFQYETNVGAGLPVITTIADLVNSGDKILKIEGILSGSLSFIFNNYAEGMTFSEIVKKAQERGFTEPDPRVDLSGQDVARKLLILARESGLRLEADDIRIDNILPNACLMAPTIEAFWEELAAADGHFEQLRASAANEGKAMRFIATLEGKEAFISLQNVDSANPFYNLSGSDNMIVFTTQRYQERPLVIKGPGAGAEVTAAGVFAEIVRIGNLLSPVLRLPEE